jgi:signal peptidase I
MMKKVYYILLLTLLFSCSIEKRVVHINSISMQPAINPGDYAILNMSVKKFTYGDIIVYEYIGEGDWESFVSLFRVVGLPGDSIGVKDAITVVNGRMNEHKLLRKDAEKEIIEETLPNGQKITVYHYFEGPGNEDMDMIKVPKDCYFILGDTRTDVIDSRFYGPASKDNILGKIIEIKKEE